MLRPIAFLTSRKNLDRKRFVLWNLLLTTNFCRNILWFKYVQNTVILYHILDFVAHNISFELDYKCLWTWFWSSLKMILNWYTAGLSLVCFQFLFVLAIVLADAGRRESRLKLLKFGRFIVKTTINWGMKQMERSKDAAGTSVNNEHRNIRRIFSFLTSGNIFLRI